MKMAEIDSNVTDAIKALYEVLDLEDDGFRSGGMRRRMALSKWVEDYLVEVYAEQRVISTKHLDSETEDMLKYHLAGLLAEELHEKDCVTTKCEDKRISTRVYALKRK